MRKVTLIKFYSIPQSSYAFIFKYALILIAARKPALVRVMYCDNGK